MQDALADIAASHVTRRVADMVSTLRAEDVSVRALELARHALLDWAGVTLAARDDDAVRIVLSEFHRPEDDTAEGNVTLIGTGKRARPLDAVLINGTAGHALDYDDVNPLLGGHPSVATIPVALALAELSEVSGRDLLTAIVAGFEAACAVGAMTRQSHYEKGFHNTATIGTFGAAATACWLMRLDDRTTAVALGLAATQAAGLKCNFGTMAKPFHAGTAAANGLRAARLAAKGFSASPTAIEEPQGFAATQVPVFDPSLWSSPLDVAPDRRALSNEPGARTFGIERTLFKYHAACYGTHGMLEAVLQVRSDLGISLDDVAAIDVHVTSRAQGQCDRPEPDTGLAMKFSMQHLAVAAIDGVDTAALATYGVGCATDPRYVAARKHVTVHFEPDRDRYVTDVVVTLTDGRKVSAQANVGTPASDLAAQWRSLAAKFDALATPILGSDRAAAARQAIATLADAPSASDLIANLSG